jgi:tRNA-splicing ligase RtcB
VRTPDGQPDPSLPAGLVIRVLRSAAGPRYVFRFCPDGQAVAPTSPDRDPTMQQITKRLLSWASMLEENTEQQARTTAQMPFVYPHLALMPDAHLGLGATVGSVIPTLGAVMPAAVGVDIGCGMIAVRTQFTRADLPEDLRPLREAIERAVPLSAGATNRTVVATAAPRIAELEALAEEAGFDPAGALGGWRNQLGTLGSGNHF